MRVIQGEGVSQRLSWGKKDRGRARDLAKRSAGPPQALWGQGGAAVEVKAEGGRLQCASQEHFVGRARVLSTALAGG